jgi:hypothetical protein
MFEMKYNCLGKTLENTWRFLKYRVALLACRIRWVVVVVQAQDTSALSGTHFYYECKQGKINAIKG